MDGSKTKPLEGRLGHNSEKSLIFVKASPEDIVKGATLFRDISGSLFEASKAKNPRYEPVTISGVNDRGDGQMRASWNGRYQTPAGHACQSGYFDFSEQKHIPLYRQVIE